MYAEIKDFCNGSDGTAYELDIDCLYDSDSKRRNTYHTICGNMNTGEAVVSSEEAKKRIVSATKIIRGLAGEMEGYGIAKECIYYHNTTCLIIKSICDWGDKKNIEHIMRDVYEQGQFAKKNNGNRCPQQLKGLLLNSKVPIHLKDKLQSYAAFCAADTLIKLFNKKRNCFFKFGLFEKLNNYTPEVFSKKALIKSIQEHYNTSDPNRIYRILLRANYIEPANSNDQYRIIF